MDIILIDYFYNKVNLLNHTVTARIDDTQGDLDPVALREYER